MGHANAGCESNTSELRTLTGLVQAANLRRKREDIQAALIHINNLSDFSVFFSLNTLMRLLEMVHPIHKWVQGVNITISETRKSFTTLARLLHLEAVVQGGEFYRQCKATS